MVSGIINSGLEGLNRSRQGLDQSAKDIASAGSANNPVAGSNVVASDESVVDKVTAATVDMKVYEFQFKASAKVVETANNMTGRLIDELV